MRDYAEAKIRSSNKIGVLDNTHRTLPSLLESLERYKDYDITLVVMDVSKDRWLKNIISRNIKYYFDDNERNKAYKNFRQIVNWVKESNYPKIFITDEYSDKVANKIIIPDFEKMKPIKERMFTIEGESDWSNFIE